MRKVSYVRYASGVLGLSLISQLFHSYNYAFYVDELGLAVSLATLSKIIFIGFDAVNDIFLGRWSDRTNTKWGKRTPWLVFGAPLFALSLILAFSIGKDFNWIQLFTYYLLVSLVFETFATIVYINFGALYPVIYRSETDRANASAFKQSFSILGMGIGASLPPFLFAQFGYRFTSIIFATIALIIVYFSVSGLHETSFEYLENPSKSNITLKEALKDTYNNKRFLFYNLAQSFSLSVNAIILTIFPLYATYSLKISSNQQSLLLMTLFISAFLFIPMWRKMILKNGVNNTWLLSFVIYALICLTLLFAFDFYSGLFASFLMGLGLSGIYITPDLIMAYIIDIDVKVHKVHREASFLAISNFVQKLSLAISAIVVWFITSLFGFVSGKQPGNFPGLTFSVLSGLIPVVLLAISYLFAKKYITYDNTHPSI